MLNNMQKLSAVLRPNRKITCVLSCIFFTCACSSGDTGDSGSQKARTQARATPHAQASAKPTIVSSLEVFSPYPPPKTYPLDPKYLEEMTLSPQMSEALEQYSPNFVMWQINDYPSERIKYYPYSNKSLPYAVKGDFNGDGIEDMAVAGHDNDSNLILAIMSKEKGWEVLRVHDERYYSESREHGKSLPYTVTGIITKKGKGYEFSYGDMATITVKLKNDGFTFKSIAYFDRHETHTLKSYRGSFSTYEYTDQFINHGEVAKSSAAVFAPMSPSAVTKLELTAPMMAALREYNEKFEPWKLSDFPADKIKDYPFSDRSMPFAVKSDFNGDGVEDIVVSGHDNADEIMIVALIASSGGYYPISLLHGSYRRVIRGKEFPFTSHTLTIMEKGRKCIAGYDKKEIVLATDGVLVKYIKTLANISPNLDDYNPELELTDRPGPEILYKYSKKFFSYPSDMGEDPRLIDKLF